MIMKKLILFIISSSFVCYSQGQQSDTNFDPFTLAQKLKEIQRRLSPKELELRDMKNQLQIMSLRVEKLVQIQSMETIKQQIINDARLERLEQQARDREYRIAVAWSQSATGKEDGRTWYNLSSEEQASYRSRFYKFYNQ